MPKSKRSESFSLISPSSQAISDLHSILKLKLDATKSFKDYLTYLSQLPLEPAEKSTLIKIFLSHEKIQDTHLKIFTTLPRDRQASEEINFIDKKDLFNSFDVQIQAAKQVIDNLLGQALPDSFPLNKEDVAKFSSNVVLASNNITKLLETINPRLNLPNKELQATRKQYILKIESSFKIIEEIYPQLTAQSLQVDAFIQQEKKPTRRLSKVLLGDSGSTKLARRESKPEPEPLFNASGLLLYSQAQNGPAQLDRRFTHPSREADQLKQEMFSLSTEKEVAQRLKSVFDRPSLKR